MCVPYCRIIHNVHNDSRSNDGILTIGSYYIDTIFPHTCYSWKICHFALESRGAFLIQDSNNAFWLELAFAKRGLNYYFPNALVCHSIQIGMGANSNEFIMLLNAFNKIWKYVGCSACLLSAHLAFTCNDEQHSSYEWIILFTCRICVPWCCSNRSNAMPAAVRRDAAVMIDKCELLIILNKLASDKW